MSSVLTTYVVSRSMAPVYEAKTTLMVGEQPLSFSESWRAVQANTVITRTYSKMIVSSPVLKRVVKEAHLSVTSAQLGRRVATSQVYETAFIQLTVSDRSPKRARRIANTVANVFVRYNDELHAGEVNSMRQLISDKLKAVEGDLRVQRQTEAQLVNGGADPQAIDDVQVKIRQLESELKVLNGEYDDVVAKSIKTTDVRVVEPAEMPQAPTKPRPRVYSLIALVVSSLGGIGLAFFFESSGERVNTKRTGAKN
jgi:capsular polysaccharide biosynthesis protein